MGTFFDDVISNDSRFNSVTRVADLNLLEPVTRELVEQIVEGAAALGFSLMVFETFRSQARQEALFAQGATHLKKVGVHHYGLACDIVKVIEGEPSWKGDFSFLGQLGHSAGLIWGGDWGNPAVPHSFVDAVHVQRCTIARQPQLFSGDWYPDATYNPYLDGDHVLLSRALESLPPRPGRKRSRRSRKSRA
jgi:hypothetical protein